MDPESILCEPLPKFAYANSNSIDDIHNPPLHIPTRSSSIDDHESGRMHSLMDVKHSSPHAEIEFADPYDPVTEANILNMHREKRATSHENENVETPKQG